MIRIVELQGSPHVFTLKDGSTLRLFARKTVEISDAQMSDDLRQAEKMNLIYCIEGSSPIPETSTKKTTTTNKEVQ